MRNAAPEDDMHDLDGSAAALESDSDTNQLTGASSTPRTSHVSYSDDDTEDLGDADADADAL